MQGYPNEKQGKCPPAVMWQRWGSSDQGARPGTPPGEAGVQLLLAVQRGVLGRVSSRGTPTLGSAARPAPRRGPRLDEGPDRDGRARERQTSSRKATVIPTVEGGEGGGAEGPRDAGLAAGAVRAVPRRPGLLRCGPGAVAGAGSSETGLGSGGGADGARRLVGVARREQGGGADAAAAGVRRGRGQHGAVLQPHRVPVLHRQRRGRRRAAGGATPVPSRARRVASGCADDDRGPPPSSWTAWRPTGCCGGTRTC